MRNYFSEKSYIECRGGASSMDFYKNSIFSRSLDQQSEML